MKSLQKILLLIVFAISSKTMLFGQEYLDADKRFMKLTAVSTDETYGFDIKNPIKIGSDDMAIGAYLNSLKVPNGDKLHLGDMQFNYKKQTGLTLVVLTFEQKKETKKVYFLSTEFEQPKALVGYAFKTVDDLPKVNTFPADSIRNVEPCAQTTYSVDDFLAKEKLGELPKPTKNPTFKGGIDDLRKYFKANPLKDEKAAELIFRVSIAFMVNCEGKAGDFIIVTKGRGDLATFANEVLAIVNSMPQNWEPAAVDGKSVDCYQVLSFSVANGKLDQVSFR